MFVSVQRYMEHPAGGHSDGGRGRGRSRPRPIRGRGTPSAPFVGMGGRGASPEVSPFESSSPSIYLSTSPSLYTSNSPSSSSDPQQGGRQHIPSPHSQIDEGGSSSNTPIWGAKDPATGKLWIRPDGTEGFDPYAPVADILSTQIFRNFNEPWGTWKEIPKDTRNRWFDEFLSKFETLPEHHKGLRKAFNHKGSKWLSGRFHKLRKGVGKTDWIDPETAALLLAQWENDEKFNNRSRKSKENRAKQVGPSYAGGSIPLSEHCRKIAQSGDVPPEEVEWHAFEQTHTRQTEGGEKIWINPRAEQVAGNYLRLTQERDSQSGTQPSSSQSDNETLFLEAAGGFNSKGRVFGLGSYASRLRESKRSTSSSSEGVCADELKRMNTIIESQAAELSETKQKQMATDIELHQTQEMVRQMQRQIQALLQNRGPMPPPEGDPPADDDEDAAA